MMHEGGDAELTTAVRKAIDGLLANLANKAFCKRVEILELADRRQPDHAPPPARHRPDARSAPRRSRWRRTRRSQTTHRARHPRQPGRPGLLLPCIAGHVGADTAGVILAEEPHETDAMTLVVDVGTNAEIVLGNRDRLLAASSPTGPAFEGAQISSGQRPRGCHRAGAQSTRTTLEPRFRIHRQSMRGRMRPTSRTRSVDAGPRDRICGSGIIEVVAELFLAGVITADGVIDGSVAERTPRVIADGRTFSYVLYEPVASVDGEAAGPALVITAERRPGDPAREGRAVRGARLLMDQLGSTPSTRSGWPARSAARSTRSTRWSSGSSRTATSAGSARPATPPGPARSSRS
jgi:hypothetical protein